MGFDPMTHRPRTDIFSSLPHLIALANLKELIENHTWEEQAMRLQTEAAQMAKLQYLQNLLQPQPPNSMAPNNFTNNNSMDQITYENLLNSLSSMKDGQGMMSSNQFGNIDLESIPFANMPDLQVPCQYQTPMMNKDMFGENSSPTSIWNIPSTSSPSPPPPPPQLAAPALPFTETSINNNMGDACSTSSYEGGPSSFWPEVLLDDHPLFHEIA